MKETAILFDLDGTLLDTLDDLMDSVNRMMEVYGCPRRTREEIRRFVGNGAGKLIARALPGRPDDPDPAEVLRAFRNHYKAHCQNKTKPYDGIPEMLEQLRAEGWPMAIVSNKPDSAVKPLRDQYFPGLYAQGETPDCPRKPDPEMVFRAARALGVEPKHCVYVGDSEVDIQTARNAGMVCLSVLWGFRDEKELRENGGVYFCADPSEIPEKVKELEKIIHGK